MYSIHVIYSTYSLLLQLRLSHLRFIDKVLRLKEAIAHVRDQATDMDLKNKVINTLFLKLDKYKKKNVISL